MLSNSSDTELVNSTSYDEAKELVLSKRESDRLNNRSIMQRLIDITILLAKTGEPFRGHNENLKFDNRGMFLELAWLLKKYDSTLKKHLDEGPKNATYIEVDSQSIFDSLTSIVEKQLGLSWLDVVAVCFDGAATMAGCSNGVQSKCKEINSKIFYVHCHAHCLNLILVDSIGRKNRIVFDFFGTIQFLYSFIEGTLLFKREHTAFAHAD
ncbi:hypothetical protein QTP88_029372 [Uroleucon formosanum]